MDDDYRMYAMLRFVLSAEEFEDVVEALAEMEPRTLYPEAWRVLCAEAERRRGWRRASEASIDLSAAVFEDLPSEIQARLRPARVPA